VTPQEIIARALWAAGNARIGHRSWASVEADYMAEALTVLRALRNNELRVVDRDVLIAADSITSLIAHRYPQKDWPRENVEELLAVSSACRKAAV
jgi:hypothetical protein